MTLNPEIDTTKFVNIDDEKFVFHINKQPREIEAGEAKTMPVYVAQIGAKHLVDKILQKKYGIKDTLKDTDLRRSLFAKILPEMAEEREIKPLSEEEFRKKVEEELEKQKKLIETLSGDVAKSFKDKDEIERLKNEIKKLKASLNKKTETPQENKGE